MDNNVYMEYRKCVDKKIRKNALDIEGDFSDFDRIFYQYDEINNFHSLLLISTKKQLFKQLNLENKQILELNINAEKEYHQVEYYDKKLFCVNRELLTIDLFFSSKKQQLFHKQTICFANKELKLKENFSLVIWNHHELGVMYRCLLGPLEDGRFMNFDVLERYFEPKTNANIMIEKVFFVKLEIDDQKSNLGSITCAMDETEKSIICFNEKTGNFFEYNDFSGKKSRFIDVMNCEKAVRNKLKRMYFYYPYDFLLPQEKNRLRAAARHIHHETESENFVRNMYTEILLCMEECSLMKMSLVEAAVMAGHNSVWKITGIDMKCVNIPIDIAINEYTGEIYCLCRQGIFILENSGRKSKILEKNTNVRRLQHIDESADS